MRKCTESKKRSKKSSPKPSVSAAPSQANTALAGSTRPERSASPPRKSEKKPRAWGDALGSSRRLRVLHRNDVKGVDGHGQFVRVNHHDNFGRNGDKVSMRYYKAPPVGQPQREGVESILQALFDLLYH